MKADRALLALHALACAILVALAVFVLVRSAPHPIESATALHGTRLAAGEKLYTDPRGGGSSFLYPPVFYALIALVERATGDPVSAGRWIGFVAVIAAFATLLALERRAGHSPLPPLAAIVTTLAAFHAGDLYVFGARVDALAGALALGAALVFFRGSDRGDARLAALGIALAVLATFTKQVYVFTVPFLLASLVTSRPRWILGLLALGCGLGMLGYVVVTRTLGAQLIFYTVTMPGSHPRSLAALSWNARSGAWLLGLVACHVLARLLGDGRRLGALRDPRLALSLLGFAVAFVAVAKVGARPNSLVPCVFLSLPWIASPASGSFTRRFIERPILPLAAAVIGVAFGIANATRAADSWTARERSLEAIREVVARTGPRRTFYTDGLIEWHERHETTPFLLESTLDCLGEEPGAWDGFMTRFLAARYELVVVSRVWEYRDGYLAFEDALIKAGYKGVALLPASPPRDAHPDGRPTEVAFYLR